MKHQLIGLFFVLMASGATLVAQSRFGVGERAPSPRVQTAPASAVNSRAAPALRSTTRFADRLPRHDQTPQDPFLNRGPRDARSRHDRGWGQGHVPVAHRGRNGYWRHVRERVWVPGQCRWVTYPARYEWRYDRCGRRVRVCCQPARRVRVQDPGYWDWQVRRVWVPGC